MHGIADVAMSGQRGGEPAHFAAAHGVGLPGQTERPRTGLADLAGGEMQVDERGVLRGSAGRLIEALAIQRQRGR